MRRRSFGTGASKNLWRGGRSPLRFLIAWGLPTLLSLPAAAQGVRDCGTTTLGTYHWVASGQVLCTDSMGAMVVCPNNCLGTTGFRCYPVQGQGSSVEKIIPACDPTVGSCAVKIHATATIKGLRDMIDEDGLGSSLTPWAEWYPCTGAGCAKDIVCGLDAAGGRINFDNLDTWLERGLSCAQALTLNLSVKLRVCSTSSCESSVVINLPAADLASALGCPPPPPPDDCATDSNTCRNCLPAGGSGGGCSVSAEGKLSCEFQGHGAAVRYRAGGAGGTGFPGTSAWRTALGLYASHAYAKRIVMDPDLNHVWLVTEGASFREFRSPAAGTGLRLYDPSLNAPSDEYRRLYFDTATAGWQLDALDGSREVFRSDGLWEKTIFARDPLHPIQASYTGSQLQSVGFPDGRQETFAYHPGGKLASITEVGVGGSPTRTWSYIWSGDELTLIARPDGTQWELTYDPAKNGGRPGYLTQLRLVGADLSGRVEAAFEYDSFGNVVKAWAGDPSFTGPQAVDRQAFSYTNPSLPTQTVATRTVSGTFNQVTTYAIGRDARSNKLRITSMQGSCPTCGLSPVTSFTYGSSTHPLMPSAMTDAKGTRTDYSYTANGRISTKTEAANVPTLTRLTTYTYDANFPRLVTRVEVPSTSGGSNKRRTDSAYDPTTSVMTTRTIDGFEAGAALPAGFKPTGYTYNASGEVLTIDPPGFGASADVTSFTYNLANRNGHVSDSRTDPLVGTTGFGYDGLNRRTSVTDPNGVQTVTSYDALNQITEVLRKGATPAADLVTTYTYNSFGDLFCTKLPRGNGMEYGYDSAGRMKEILRGTTVATPTSTNCLDAAQPRERTAYQLDGSGHLVEESLERWTGTAWASDSKTAYEYTCHLDKVTRGSGSATPSVTENCHDANDNLEKVWDENHPKASNPNPTQLYAYDALNRLTTLTVGVGTINAAATGYNYDVQDHLTSVADAEGNLTTYATSDRDLMTQQVSPVSGTTTYLYNEHSQLVATTDSRSIVTTNTVDVADRVTQATFGPSGSPDSALTTTYAYGSTPAQFNVGRLTGITRNSQTIAYTYDRFGRVLQDGSLTYGYDKNSNRATITYPGGVSAAYTYDFADRDATLSYNDGLGSHLLVTGATYKALGPLATLAFANGLAETRLFDQRYFPDRIQAGSLLDWDYAVDPVGNPTAITGSIVGTSYSPTFAYQDSLYFLTQGNGPWGNRAWTYDKVGNRLTFARTSEPTQSYAYSGTGHNPKLASITPASGWGTGSWAYSHDPAGNQTSIVESNDEGAVQTTFYDIAADGRMSTLRTDTGPSKTDFLYDGRGYLREGLLTVTGSSDNLRVTPAYSSNGTLMARTEARQWTGSTIGPDGEDQTLAQMSNETTQLFYFAGRPVAQLTSGPELLYLTTDHLGTPVLATDTSGVSIWAGGVEPFGRTWTAGPDNPDPELAAGKSGPIGQTETSALGTLASEKVFLRYPGQWVSDAFRVTGGQEEIYYNVNRWIETNSGRFTTPDPLGRQGDSQAYAYSRLNPLRYVDRLGLLSFDESCYGCLGQNVGDPSSPTQLGIIVQGVQNGCKRLLNGITDVGLRDCIAKSCQEGKIDCRTETWKCGPGKLGHTDIPFFPGLPVTRKIRLCVNNWDLLSPHIGETAVHEFAHGCGWGHGQGAGVPGNLGAGF